MVQGGKHVDGHTDTMGDAVERIAGMDDIGGVRSCQQVCDSGGSRR